MHRYEGRKSSETITTQSKVNPDQIITTKWLLYKLLCKTGSCDEQSHQQTDEWNWQPWLHATLTLVVGVLQVVELFGEEVLDRHRVNRAQVSLAPQLTIQYTEDVIWNRGSTHTQLTIQIHIQFYASTLCSFSYQEIKVPNFLLWSALCLEGHCLWCSFWNSV